MVQVLAPVESVEVNIAESFPPQYFLQVTSGLPNGCVEFDGYEVDRSGDTITVKMTNLEPAKSAEPRACTMLYGMVETNIPLGSNFEGGVTYTVLVNDVTETFVAQGSAGPEPIMGGGSSDVLVKMGEPVSIGIGDGAVFNPGEFRIQLLEVMEDSRCPTDAKCVWEGRATILVGVSGNMVPSLIEVTLGSPTRGVAGYTVDLIELDPPPSLESDQEGGPAYVATIRVTSDGSDQ